MLCRAPAELGDITSDIQGRKAAAALKPGKAKALGRALRMCSEKRPYVEISSLVHP